MKATEVNTYSHPICFKQLNSETRFPFYRRTLFCINAIKILLQTVWHTLRLWHKEFKDTIEKLSMNFLL